MPERRADLVPPEGPERPATSGASVEGGEGTDAPGEANSRQRKGASQALARRWADPAFRARMSERMKARWADPAYRAYAGSFNRDCRVYRWVHAPTGLTVLRTRAEMREEHGLKRDALDALVAGSTKSSQGWRLAPLPLLGRSPIGIFP